METLVDVYYTPVSCVMYTGTDSLSAEHLGSDVVHSTELGGGTGWDRPGSGHCPPLRCGDCHHHSLHVCHLHQWRGEGGRSLLPHLPLPRP